MITHQAATEFEATLDGAPEGLEGTVALRLIDDDTGDVVIARSTDDIAERAQGLYVATRTAPAVGDYLLVWDLGDPDDEESTFSEELQVYAAGVYPDLPGTNEVATLLWARTKDDVGVPSGEFTEDTRPTGAQVARLIRQAAADVAMRVGTLIPDELVESVKYSITLRAASLVELTYFPEQAQDTRSGYQSLRLTYEEAVRTLVTSLNMRKLFAETEPEEVEA